MNDEVNTKDMFSPDREREFKQLFETFYPRLLRFANEYVGSTHDAEDIVQNVFLKLWEKRTSLPVDTNLNAYLLTMVKNHCLDFLKHQQVVNRFSINRKAELQREMEFNYYAISKFDAEQMDKETLEQLVEKAISELPVQCRKAFELSRYEGLKYREIAEKMGISVKTVETHISNALKILRITLKDCL
jgi:RNA polymerase sigma-70 factor (ECF subfamily)